MAPQNPPRDDEKPETDTTESSPEVETEIEDQGETPRATSTDSDGAVDAEIIETIAESETTGSETVEEAEMVMNSDDTDEAEEIVADAAIASANENDQKSGGLATPFAILVGAGFVVVALIYFLNNNNTSTPLERTDGPDPFAENVELIAQPITAQPIVKQEETTSTEDLVPTRSEESVDVAGIQEVEATETLDPVAEDVATVIENDVTPTEESTSATVVALVSGETANNVQDTEELTERRTALIAEAAERNRARREARNGQSEETVLPTTTESEDLPTDVSHAVTSVSSEIISAAVEPNETDNEQIEVMAKAVEAETPDGAQVTEGQNVFVRENEEQAVTEIQPIVAPTPDFEEIKSDLRADVLAETELVIDEKFQQAEQEVRALRTELTEQQRVSNERLAALARKIDSLETSELNTTRQSTLLLALSDLGNGIRSGEPFIKELDNVERMAENSRSLAPLRDHAAAGLPTDTELRTAYSAAARQALSNSQRDEADGPLAKLGSNITGLFSVRKVGDVEGDTPSAIIARADDHLNSGDLEGAVQELENLAGPAAEAFTSWINAASAKVDAQSRIDAMERSITARAG